MAEKKQERRGLGRGLSALMADVPPAVTPTTAGVVAAERQIPVERIRPNPNQPRRSFTEDQLRELTDSIREKGIIQPLILREDPARPEYYEIVAGERRWRAAQAAQLHQVPAVVRDYNDTEVLEVAIIENIQRANLNPVEEAAGYRQLMDRFGHTQEHVAEALGKSRSHIANLLRLLNLPEDVQQMLRDGKLSAGHARALVTTDNPTELARQVIAKGLSVRDTEKLAKGPAVAKPKAASPKGEKDADTRALEQDLTAALGMKLRIDHAPGTEQGQVTIQYQNLDELDRLCQALSMARS
jgi:ParB family chromosome partitioning protein